MLAAHKPYDLPAADPKVERNRRRGDERMQRLAAREARELRFRDLILAPRPASAGPPERLGRRQPAHVRRGHWKRVPYGPKHSLRKWDWIDPYRVGETDDDAPMSETILH